MLDYGLDLQAAIAQPRVFPPPGETGEVQVESGVPEEARKGLEARGHNLTAPPKPLGGAQAIRIDWDAGTLTGGSEPRKDGCAMGY